MYDRLLSLKGTSITLSPSIPTPPASPLQSASILGFSPLFSKQDSKRNVDAKMSSRALRKAQRQREEQQHLRKLEQPEQGHSEEDDATPEQPVTKSAFALLAAADDEADEGSQGPDSDVGEGDATLDAPAPSTSKTSSGKKNKKRKKKSKGHSTSTPTEPAEQNDEDLDDIDKALKELSTNGNASTSATTASGISLETDDLCRLLAVDSSHLHAQNEMRRLFGRTALEDHEDEPAPNPGNVGGNRRQQRQVQRMGLAQALRGQTPGARAGALSQMALKRNIFAQGKEEWPNATSGGLGMEVEEKRADGTILYRFVHNRAYQEVQSQFEIAVESMDPNRLIVMLQQNPYHISTLLQVSEIAKQDRENAMSGDLLERALFSFGRAVQSTFAKTLAEGKARLDFRRPENREFWLAGWRYMQNLTMRATWRTAYEWAKLLLSLSPEDDPYGMLLILDQYALRARQDLDYINLSRSAVFKEKLVSMPNSRFSQGLAEFRAGNQSKGRQTLYKAVGLYPWVVARLMQENNATQIPPAIWGKEPRTDREKLYSELYVTRAKDIWNTPEASTVLLEVSSALPPDTPSATIDDNEITMNEARHVLLSDSPSLIALIPRTYTAQLDSASDPLPPLDSYASSIPGRSTESSIEAMDYELHSLVQFLTSSFPEQDLQALPEEDVQRIIHEAGPERGARIVAAARRVDALHRRRQRLELGSLEDIVGRMGLDMPGGFDGERAAAMLGQRARVEDAPDEAEP